MTTLDHAVVDAAELRSTLGHFPTGVVVVTTLHAGVHSGMTLQSFVSLSLEPPLVLLSVARSSATWPVLAEAGHFVVNVLAHEQGALARQFARSGTDKFAGVELVPVAGVAGPVLAGAVAWVDCTLENQFDGGDHLIVVGRVRALGLLGEPSERDEPASPLVFHRSSFQTLSTPAPSAAPHPERKPA